MQAAMQAESAMEELERHLEEQVPAEEGGALKEGPPANRTARTPPPLPSKSHMQKAAYSIMDQIVATFEPG